PVALRPAPAAHGCPGRAAGRRAAPGPAGAAERAPARADGRPAEHGAAHRAPRARRGAAPAAVAARRDGAPTLPGWRAVVVPCPERNPYAGVGGSSYPDEAPTGRRTERPSC